MLHHETSTAGTAEDGTVTHVYLDHSATTPIDPRVRDAMLPFLGDTEAFGNPSRPHWAGAPAKRAIAEATEEVAALIGAEPDELFFTGGGTDSVNAAIKGMALPILKSTRRRRVLTSAIEHPAALASCTFLETYSGACVNEIGVDTDGKVRLDMLRDLAGPDTVLINVMHASHEIGTLQPVTEIAELARERDIPFHVDAICSAGKNSINVKAIGCDLMSISGHKFYAPKGIAAVYVSHKVRAGWPGMTLNEPFAPLLSGLTGSGNLRPGTPNVAGIVGMGKAAALARAWLTPENRADLARRRDYLWHELRASFEGRVHRNGPADLSVSSPNCLNVSFDGWEGEALLAKLPNLAASAGVKSTNVVRATGESEARARGAIRFSLGRDTSYAELDAAVAQLREILHQA